LPGVAVPLRLAEALKYNVSELEEVLDRGSRRSSKSRKSCSRRQISPALVRYRAILADELTDNYAAANRISHTHRRAGSSQAPGLGKQNPQPPLDSAVLENYYLHSAPIPCKLLRN
jgi:hypothetical protein